MVSKSTAYRTILHSPTSTSKEEDFILSRDSTIQREHVETRINNKNVTFETSFLLFYNLTQGRR